MPAENATCPSFLHWGSSVQDSRHGPLLPLLSLPSPSLWALGSSAMCLPAILVVLKEGDVCPTLARQILTNELKC